MDLVTRAHQGATLALEAAAFLLGIAAVLLVIALATYGPLVAWRAAAYRLHVARVSRRLRREA